MPAPFTSTLPASIVTSAARLLPKTLPVLSSTPIPTLAANPKMKPSTPHVKKPWPAARSKRLETMGEVLEYRLQAALQLKDPTEVGTPNIT